MRQTRKSEFLPDLAALAPARWGRVRPMTFERAARWGEHIVIALCLGSAFLIAGMAEWPVTLVGPWLLAGAALLLLWARLTRPGQGQILGVFDPACRPVSQALRLWLLLVPLLLVGSATIFGPDAALIVGAALLPAALASVLWRAALAALVPRLIRKGMLGLRVVIAGGGREAADTLAHLAQLRSLGVQTLALFDDRENARSPPMQGGVAKLGRIRDLPAFLQQTQVDLIIVTMPPRAEARLLDILSMLWALPVDIRLAPVQSSIIYRPRTYRWLGGLALLDLFDRPLRPQDAALKRGFDLVIGGGILLALAPLMGVIALLIRLDSPGPVFFRQAREGYAGVPFSVWKFRTLQHDLADHGAVVPVTAGDPRVTRMGHLLRRSSLDELPQLFNVIAGSMSLVGPRPHAVGARNRDMVFARVVQGYAVRHRVKPGITGLAQIQGLRGPVQSAEQIHKRVTLDLDYIDRWSLGLDLWILMQTLPTVLRGENAV